jgi:hypothetical protein
MADVLAVIGLFVLRLGVPIIMMALLSWAVSWYARREEMRALEVEEQPATAQLAPTAPSS